MRRKNDRLWKGIFEEVMEDMLLFFFPRAEEIFDMQRGFEFLDKELNEIYPESDKASGTRYVDKLVKVYKKDGSCMLLHIEAQGYNDPLFGKRMFTYFYRILDRYDRPVMALAVFTEQSGKNMPDRYQLLEHGSELLYKYNVFCVRDYDDDELAKSDNPFALVLMIARMALVKGKNLDERLLQQKLLIVRLLYQMELSERKLSAILTFLKQYVKFNNSETNRIFMEQLDMITGKKFTGGIFDQVEEEARTEGLNKGIRKGEQKARLEFVKTLLANTKFSVDKIASLAGVSIAFVEKIRQKKK